MVNPSSAHSLIEILEGLNPEPHLMHMCSVHTDTQTHTASSYFTMLLNAINSRATSP